MTDLPISAVAAFAFCPRQAYLTLAEGMQGQTGAMAEGRVQHQTLPRRQRDTEHPCTYSLRVAHERLGLVGVVDRVIWTPEGPLPVEHKRSEGPVSASARVQLTLYALCLEEQLGVEVPHGLVTQGLSGGAEWVWIDEQDRAEAEELIWALRAALAQERAPRAAPFAGCRGCSLNPSCLPQLTDGARSVRALRDQLLGLNPEDYVV